MPSIVYLTELMNPFTGELENSDVCVRLDVAVEQVKTHLLGYPVPAPKIEVSVDPDGELEGVGFFNSHQEIVSCITVYNMERDTEVAKDAAVKAACEGPLTEMESKLNKIFEDSF